MKKKAVILFLLVLTNVYWNSMYAQTSQSRTTNKASGFSDGIRCTTIEKKNPQSKEDPFIIKTCVWQHYKFVVTGEPDYKGRYGYTYELFVVEKGKYKKIQNSDLFNDKLAELEDLINRKIKADFDDSARDPNASDCFTGTTFTKFQINDMGISLNDKNEMEFNVSFGLGGACMSVDGTTVTLSMTDLKKYLK